MREVKPSDLVDTEQAFNVLPVLLKYQQQQNGKRIRDEFLKIQPNESSKNSL